MKKGVLLTLASYIIAMLIFSLALIIFHNTQQAEEIFSEQVVSDRMFNIFSSVENSIKDVFEYYFPLNITILKYNNKTDLTFTETISKTKEGWGKEFDNKIELFKTYVEEREPTIKIYTEILKDKELPVKILPHNIEYSRSWQTGLATIDVKPQTTEDNFHSYDLIVYTNNIEISDVREQLRAAGNFRFKVTAKDDYGHNIIAEKLIDPEKNHQVQIFLVGGNKIKITLNDKQLEIWTNSPNEIEIAIILDELEQLEEEISVEYTKSSIFINFPKFNISKNSTINLI